MGAMSDAARILRETFGYHAFRGQQAEIIEHAIGGGDALVIMPTGGGKSLCYQIPALARPGTGLVISPLIALMQDQVAALRAQGVAAAAWHSGLDGSEQAQVLRDFSSGALKLLYLSPERLLRDGTLQRLTAGTLALIAIDEAHCVSQWGHDFRPEYMGLGVLAQAFPQVPRMALTATADAPTRREIGERLELGRARVFIGGFDRPNIRYHLREGDGARSRLQAFLRSEHDADSGIIYCTTRKATEQVADWLTRGGRSALPYHAGLSADMRAEHQRRFQREDGLVMAATIAFGMGIDKPDVRFVAHLGLPKSIESYYQETGRAGRDGLPANAWLGYGLSDIVATRQLIAGGGHAAGHGGQRNGTEGGEQRRRLELQKFDAMLGLAESTACRRQTLLGYFGEAPAGPCGNCDNCLYPPQTFDGTEAAQLALSCIYRTGQRFGVAYLASVLRGEADERVRRFGHDRLRLFGLGAERSASAWRGIYRQLVARGLASVDFDGHGGLRLTEAARPVLRGEQRLELRAESVRPAPSRQRRGSTLVAEADRGLFEALRAERKRLAEQAGVPAYVVFQDATLAEMASQRPVSAEELAVIGGVGATKLERYGDAFLAVIRAST